MDTTKEVKLSIGFTVNLGDFNSTRVEVGEVREVNDSCSRDQAYEDMISSVEERLNSLLGDLTEVKLRNKKS